MEPTFKKSPFNNRDRNLSYHPKYRPRQRPIGLPDGYVLHPVSESSWKMSLMEDGFPAFLCNDTGKHVVRSSQQLAIEYCKKHHDLGLKSDQEVRRE